MTLAVTLLLLIFAVVISNLIAANIHIVPAAFWDIGAGLLLSLLPWFHNFEMVPEVFLFVIISVLMFNEGQHTNIRLLVNNLGSTLSMSVWLSLATIVIVGLVTHLFLPVAPLPLAFVLGAIITPTDSVAVTSITADLKVPDPVMSTLETESLFNDASGLVVFNLCIAAMTTGYFSIFNAATDFLYVFGGGIVLGLVLGWLIVLTRLLMIRRRLSGPQIIIPYNLLTPFIVYFIAELIGVSGILAVVAAGIVHGWQQNVLRLSSSRLQVTTNSAWELFSSVLNGVVFVLLGVSFPKVWDQLSQHSLHNWVLLLMLGLTLYLTILIVRFLWVYFRMVRVHHQRRETRVTDSALIAINGIHGTITLAMAFSLPLHIKNQPFYERSDLIFVATVVIVLSLLVPTVVLKLTLPAKEQPFTLEELDKAKGETINAAITTILQRPVNDNTRAVIQTLNSQRSAPTIVNRKKINALMAKTKKIEQATISQMVQEGKITEQDARDYDRMAAMMYRRYDRNFLQAISDYWNRFVPFSKLNRAHRKRQREVKRQSREERNAARQQWLADMKRIEEEPYEVIGKYLNSFPNAFERPEIMMVRSFYDQRHRIWNRTREAQSAQNQLLTSAFQEEYSYVQNNVLNGTFSKQLGTQLFDDLANDQMLYIQQSTTD